MKAFTIESDTNNITVHRTIQEAEAIGGRESFNSEAGLAKLAEEWPAGRLVEIWNSLPGVTPVKRFTDRKAAVSRIWKAVQAFAAAAPIEEIKEKSRLVATRVVAVMRRKGRSNIIQLQAVGPDTPPDGLVGAPAAGAAPKAIPASHKSSRAKRPNQAPTRANVDRAGSKTDAVLTLIRRPGGATLKDIIEANQWQAHSVRGFISGTLNRRMGLSVVSSRIEKGERTYSITL